jgi:hypothetical protein
VGGIKAATGVERVIVPSRDGNAVRVVWTALAALILMSACESPGFGGARGAKEQPETGSANPASSPRSGSASGSGNQGGETNPTAYTDARYHYRISTPGPMKAQPDGSAIFVGEDERFEVMVIEGTKAADPAAVAEEDLGSLSRSTPGFQVLIRPTPVTLGGQRMIKWTYQSTGKSFSGKQTTFFSVRYYIASDQRKLAVVSYRDAAGEFDVKEADEFAGSFRWL